MSTFIAYVFCSGVLWWRTCDCCSIGAGDLVAIRRHLNRHVRPDFEEQLRWYASEWVRSTRTVSSRACSKPVPPHSYHAPRTCADDSLPSFTRIVSLHGPALSPRCPFLLCFTAGLSNVGYGGGGLSIVVTQEESTGTTEQSTMALIALTLQRVQVLSNTVRFATDSSTIGVGGEGGGLRIELSPNCVGCLTGASVALLDVTVDGNSAGTVQTGTRSSAYVLCRHC
jgi:hypothetical protein